MRHTKHLPASGNLTQLHADLLCRLAGNAGVDLVENECRDTVAVGDDGFEGEHDARQFAAGCDLRDGLRNFALVREDQERHGVHALNGQLALFVLHGEDDIRHIKEAEFLRHALHEMLRRLLAVSRQRVGFLGDIREQLRFLGFEFRDP